MRCLKIFLVLILSAGLVGVMGVSSLVMADQYDPPHQTHLTAARGPELDPDCTACHTASPGTFANLKDSIEAACYLCHSPGGPYDGVNHSVVGALNNWENMGSSDDATQSLIYEDGGLKGGKDEWCATCHDESLTGSNLIDGFDHYSSIPGPDYIFDTWVGVNDVGGGSLGTGGPTGQYLNVTINWQRSPASYGRFGRYFTPAIDVTGKNAFNFRLVMGTPAAFKGIIVRLRKAGTSQFCAYTFCINNPIGNYPVISFESGVPKQVSLPKEGFSDPSCFEEGSGVKVDFMDFYVYENDPGGAHVYGLSIDEIGFDPTPNVIGDNVDAGYYVTGHGAEEFECKWCHDATSQHIDGDARPILDYIKYDINPTNFRFYPDDLEDPENGGNGMQLPYTQYIPGRGPGTSFALCYKCHKEECITQNEGAASLNTNFKDPAYHVVGPDNLHLFHVGGENYPDEGMMIPSVFHGTCVLCHDPHGQSNPAMSRPEMGNFICFDADGCEVPPAEWRNPAVNVGGAQTEGGAAYEPLCVPCHTTGVPPNEPPCNPGDNPYTGAPNPTAMNGYYTRTYNTGVCTSPVSPSHDIHISGDARGPQPALLCDDCHGISPIKDACTTCHSPEGAIDGVDDLVVGAWTNWADTIYDYDADPTGGTLKPGKEQWCLGCHDDDPTTPENESSEITVDEVGTVYAPGIAGVDYTPDPTWYSPDSSATAPLLIDGNPGSGYPMGPPFQGADFYLGDVYLITDVRLYMGSWPSGIRWQVLAGDGATWTPILGGDQPDPNSSWKTAHLGPGWYEAKVDVYLRADNLRILVAGAPLIGPPMVFEIEYKKDNLSYGFYSTGHGIDCSNCHDLTQGHIDGDQRTYASASDNYQAAYRLGTANDVPLEKTSTGVYVSDYALCDSCHDLTPFQTDDGSWPFPGTNFCEEVANQNNGHYQHLAWWELAGDDYFDSDFDGTADSDMTCTACHNVHGSPTAAMIRHGELIDHVPALSFRYSDSDSKLDGYLTAAWPDSTGGQTYFWGSGAGTVAKNGICGMCHNDAWPYTRTPEELTIP